MHSTQAAFQLQGIHFIVERALHVIHNTTPYFLISVSYKPISMCRISLPLFEIACLLAHCKTSVLTVSVDTCTPWRITFWSEEQETNFYECRLVSIIPRMSFKEKKMFKKGNMNSNPCVTNWCIYQFMCCSSFSRYETSSVFAAFIIIGLDAYISHISYLKRIC